MPATYPYPPDHNSSPSSRHRDRDRHQHRRRQPRVASVSSRPTSGPATAALPTRANTGNARKLTPWILRTDTTSHGCADLWLFRPSSSQHQHLVYREAQTRHRTETATEDLGTVVLPILPGPVRRFGFDVSVMTLSPVVHTPGAQHSELSWPVLAAQGFTLHELHHDHEHDVTWRHLERGHAHRAGRHRHASKRTSVIRHRNIPGVDLLWTGHDQRVSPHTFVHFTAIEMVDLDVWSRGIEMGVVGRCADVDTDMNDVHDIYVGDGNVDGLGDFTGTGGLRSTVTVGWVDPGNRDSEGDEDDGIFEAIVQGGARAEVQA
ncbi:hypothetical protein A1O1_00135 [Capronia coronata CBS 617.96]|uniref:Uncharacterized protein n=1 Tax=Capronia coronata CBS 617.96 TaxID=1182541 RepID=W9YQ20_9EURO|nr:uncharacterized protein A1O1_00135 [Capronia coronata CBS 617.96]EXJ95017.1 hypothetical protein A1O1_00135 [Capronia coronata CBS 617.96]